MFVFATLFFAFSGKRKTQQQKHEFAAFTRVFYVKGYIP
jgi:hypothetical protein